jgi:hypothetical protein
MTLVNERVTQRKAAYLFECVFACSLSRVVDSKQVVAIDADRSDAVTDATCRNAIAAVLLAYWRADSPAIVAAEEYRGGF